MLLPARLWLSMRTTRNLQNIAGGLLLNYNDDHDDYDGENGMIIKMRTITMTMVVCEGDLEPSKYWMWILQFRENGSDNGVG